MNKKENTGKSAAKRKRKGKVRKMWKWSGREKRATVFGNTAEQANGENGHVVVGAAGAVERFF